MNVCLQVDHRPAGSACLGPIEAGRIGQHHQRNFKAAGTGAEGRDGDGRALALQLGDEPVHIRQRRGLLGITQFCPGPRTLRFGCEFFYRATTDEVEEHQHQQCKISPQHQRTDRLSHCWAVS